jgi:3-dehydro-L-gulonate 2-dehydrogenase
MAGTIVNRALEDLQLSDPVQPGGIVSYPGYRTYLTRQENLDKGIPVSDAVWNTILGYLEKKQ